MDDFGTGYSSLSYLHRFPSNALKIDRSFVSRIGFEGENLEIVRAIVTLAHSLNIDTVAEGVETPEQLARQKSKGIHAKRIWVILIASQFSQRLFFTFAYKSIDCLLLLVTCYLFPNLHWHN